MVLKRDEVELVDFLTQGLAEVCRNSQDKGDLTRRHLDMCPFSGFLGSLDGSFDNGAGSRLGGVGAREVGHPHPEEDEEQRDRNGNRKPESPVGYGYTQNVHWLYRLHQFSTQGNPHPLSRCFSTGSPVVAQSN